MSSKTDAGDGGRGAPPTKPKVKGYKRRYRDPRRENKKPAATRPVGVTFSRLTKYLKVHIYYMWTVSQADQFTATTKALASHAGRKCTDSQVIRISVERQKDVKILIPSKRMEIYEDVANILIGK